MEATYDIKRSYGENYERGPQFASPVPELPAPGPALRFLGLPVRSRIGIAAGLLLNSRWVEGYARRGFDLLTYKTVRSSARPCYPQPNWVFVEPDPEEPGRYEVVAEPASADPSAISSSVCFGMPSMEPEVWRADVARARATLTDGQLLIVSVVATPQSSWGEEELAQDFANCARWARESGADVVEANFSCPNVCSAEGSIYRDPELSGRIARAIKAELRGTPLLVKTGYFEEDRALADYLRALNGRAQGITLVNCLSGRVVHPDGRPAFGEEFAEAGVLGRAIHERCVESVRRARTLIARESLALEIAAVGGVSRVEDLFHYREAGADAILMGSSPMYLPNLAAEAKRAQRVW